MSKLSSENRLSDVHARMLARTHAHPRWRARSDGKTCRVSEINAQNELSAGDKNTLGFAWASSAFAYLFFLFPGPKSVSRGFARSSARAKHAALHGILHPICVSASVANSGRQRVFLAFLGFTAEGETLTMAVLFLQLLSF